MLIQTMSIEQTLQQEIEESNRWLDIEKRTPHTNEIFKKESN